jgi:hypothetical protein
MFLNIIIGGLGGLSVISGVLQAFVKNIKWWSGLILALGGGLMVGSLFLSSMNGLYLLTLGLLLTHLSAVINNYMMYGKINKTHHFARLIGAVLIIVAQWMAIQ